MPNIWPVYEPENPYVYLEKHKREVNVGDTIDYVTNNQEGRVFYKVVLNKKGKKDLDEIVQRSPSPSPSPSPSSGSSSSGSSSSGSPSSASSKGSSKGSTKKRNQKGKKGGKRKSRKTKRKIY
jgi:hypothetical protein